MINLIKILSLFIIIFYFSAANAAYEDCIYK